jgi:hypothetical protein
MLSLLKSESGLVFPTRTETPIKVKEPTWIAVQKMIYTMTNGDSALALHTKSEPSQTRGLV